MNVFRSRNRTVSAAVAAIIGLGLAAAFGGFSGRAASASTVATGGASHYPRGTVVALHRRTVQVTISNFAFHPASLVVSPGTHVVWTNKDSDPHTVSAVNGHWSSDALDTGDHYTHTLTAAGTLTYYCTIHPFMHGTLIVKK